MSDARRLPRISLFYGVLFAIAALWASVQERNLFLARDSQLGMQLVHAGLGLLVGLLVARGSQQLALRYAWARRLERALAESIGPFSTSEALFVALLSALGEEALFRGAMQPAVGLIATSLAFGLLHVGPGRVFLPWTAMAVGAGFLFGGLFLLTGNLLTPVLAHATINFVNLRHMARSYPASPGPEAPP